MKTFGKVLLGIAGGFATGAVLGLLFAPDKGSETRRKIGDAAKDYTERLKTMKDSITGKVKIVHNGHVKRSSRIEEEM